MSYPYSVALFVEFALFLFGNESTSGQDIPCFKELGKAHLPHDPDRAISYAVGDVDGDGDVDLLAYLNNCYEPSVFLNLTRQVDAPYLARVGTSYTV